MLRDVQTTQLQTLAAEPADQCSHLKKSSYETPPCRNMLLFIRHTAENKTFEQLMKRICNAVLLA